MELRPGSTEPAYFTLTSDVAVADPPLVRFDEADPWHPTAWEDAVPATTRRAFLLVAHPTSTSKVGAVELAIGEHTAETMVTDGAQRIVRPAPDTIVVVASTAPTL